MTNINTRTFTLPSIIPLLEYHIFILDIKSCLYLGLFLNINVHQSIFWACIILQIDVIYVEYILFQKTIIVRSYTSKDFWILFFFLLTNKIIVRCFLLINLYKLNKCRIYHKTDMLGVDVPKRFYCIRFLQTSTSPISNNSVSIWETNRL